MQARWGTKPDGICIVVGTCARGFHDNTTGMLVCWHAYASLIVAMGLAELQKQVVMHALWALSFCRLLQCCNEPAKVHKHCAVSNEDTPQT